MRERFSRGLAAFVVAGAGTVVALGQGAVTAPEGPQVIPGEQLDPANFGPAIVESMEAAIARDLARADEFDSAAEADAPKNGRWAVPSPGAATHAHSGRRYLVNKHGATEMAIAFHEPVDVVGAALAGQGSAAVAAQCLRVTGYRDGQVVDRTDWLYLDAESRFFDFGLLSVDRMVFEAPAMYGGAAFFGLDDLMFEQAGETTVLDFEDVNHKQVLTGTDYAGLIWELGSPGFRGRTGIIPAPRQETLREAKGGLETAPGLGLRGLGTAPTLGLNFEGVRRGDAGQFSAPPDTHGAIGPNHFVITVNFNFAIYDKATGAELSNIAISSFLPGSIGDPRVLYDQHSDRWVVINDDFDTTVYLAVSETSDPTGNWFKTSIVFSTGSDTGCFPDYPTLGVDQDGIYIGSYMVGCGMSIFAIDKAPLIAASPSLGTVTAFRGFPFEGALQPVHTYGTPAGQYIISTRTTSQLAVRQVTGPMTAPTLTDLGSVSVASFGEPPDVVVQGAATPLDSVSSRLMNAVYRNGRIYTAHAVNMGGRAGVRWYEIDAGGLSVLQTGDVSDASLGFVMPTICVNAAGDMALGFSGADANTYASAYYAGRVSTDPPGEMSDPVLLRAGQAPHEIIDSFGRNRFGDYSQTSLDPVDELTFWTVQEWVQGTDIWSTWVAQLQATQPTIQAAITSSAPALIAPGATTTVDVSIVEGTETVQTASLLYRFDGGGFVTVPLSDLGGGNWQGVVPGPACGDAPEWYISVTGSGSTTVTDPSDAPATVLSAAVGTVSTLFSDNFQTDTGWTTAVESATSGAWERGVPVNDPGWDYDPAADSDGSGQCYLTQNVAGNTDVDGGTVRLISPVLDMSAVSEIRYDYYLNMTNQAGTDFLQVDIDANDGNWVPLVSHGTGGGTAWRSSVITAADLASAGVTPGATMRVRFSANDADPQSIVEAGVDAFEIVEISCVTSTGCTGDFDDDGVIGLSDLAILLSNFGGSGAGIPGDTDDDDDVDLTDLATLLTLFGSSCP